MQEKATHKQFYDLKLDRMQQAGRKRKEQAKQPAAQTQWPKKVNKSERPRDEKEIWLAKVGKWSNLITKSSLRKAQVCHPKEGSTNHISHTHSPKLNKAVESLLLSRLRKFK